jgi:hypothetical protein
MTNPWMVHVKATMKANKGKKFKEVLKLAKKTYKKQGKSKGVAKRRKSHKSKRKRMRGGGDCALEQGGGSRKKKRRRKKQRGGHGGGLTGAELDAHLNLPGSEGHNMGKGHTHSVVEQI